MNNALVHERLCGDANKPAVDFGGDGALIHDAHVRWPTIATRVAYLSAVAAYGDAWTNCQRATGVDHAEGITPTALGEQDRSVAAQCLRTRKIDPAKGTRNEVADGDSAIEHEAV